MRHLLFLFAFVSIISFAQDEKPVIDLEKEERDKMEFAGVFKSSISAEFGGKAGLAGVSYDLLLSKRWRIGAGIGYPGAGMDVKLYPKGVGRDRLIFNLGLRANAVLPPGQDQYAFYSLPLGFSYFAANRINLEFDMGPMYKVPITGSLQETGLGHSVNYVWVSFKLGYRFSFYAMKRARQLADTDH